MNNLESLKMIQFIYLEIKKKVKR